MKNHTFASIKCSTYMLVPALCFGLWWCGFPFQRACIVLINLYMQAAQPKASNQGPSLNRDWTIQTWLPVSVSKKKEKKLSPDFLLHMIFNLCPLKYFLKINQVFRFRNQSLSIPCQDVLFKSNLNQGLTNSAACWHQCIAFLCAL